MHAYARLRSSCAAATRLRCFCCWRCVLWATQVCVCVCVCVCVRAHAHARTITGLLPVLVHRAVRSWLGEAKVRRPRASDDSADRPQRLVQLSWRRSMDGNRVCFSTLLRNRPPFVSRRLPAPLHTCLPACLPSDICMCAGHLLE